MPNVAKACRAEQMLLLLITVCMLCVLGYMHAVTHTNRDQAGRHFGIPFSHLEAMVREDGQHFHFPKKQEQFRLAFQFLQPSAH